jgi:hypothetical protein
MTLAPLPLDAVEPEQLVVVEIVDGMADESLVHLPAYRSNSERGSRFVDYDFPPSVWPPACKAFTSGSVYARGGEFAGSLICRACEEAV